MSSPTLGRILTAIVTPFDKNLRVDEEAFVALHHDVCQNGSDGIVVCGTTGEATTLTDEEHLALIELAVKHKPAGTTVVAGASSNDTRHAVFLTEEATKLGVDGILSSSPYYNRPNHRGLYEHFKHVAAATDKPIVLYNIPTRTAIDMPNGLLAQLAELDHVEYVKQANPANLALIDGLHIYAGNDDLFAQTLDIGGYGGILVASHLVGRQLRRMVDHEEERAEIDQQLQVLYAALGVTTNPIPVKAALRMLGYEVGGLRLPLLEADEEEKRVIYEALVQVGLLAQRQQQGATVSS